jgi:hypothetical protein
MRFNREPDLSQVPQNGIPVIGGDLIELAIKHAFMVAAISLQNLGGHMFVHLLSKPRRIVSITIAGHPVTVER